MSSVFWRGIVGQTIANKVNVVTISDNIHFVNYYSANNSTIWLMAMTIMGHVDVHRCYAEEIGAICKSLQFFTKPEVARLNRKWYHRLCMHRHLLTNSFPSIPHMRWYGEYFYKTGSSALIQEVTSLKVVWKNSPHYYLSNKYAQHIYLIFSSMTSSDRKWRHRLWVHRQVLVSTFRSIPYTMWYGKF